jgi:hypothetical protein
VALNESTPAPAVTVHCGNDNGSVDTVVFRRNPGAPVVVTVHLTGSRFATSTCRGLFWLSASASAVLKALDPNHYW